MDFYFKIHESEQYAFYSIPKVLYTDQCYKDLSSDAKVLYGILLDRMSLSRSNGWADEEGRVFIYFSRDEVGNHLGFARQKVVKLFKELNSFDLIEEVRQGQSKPNRIYVKKFMRHKNHLALDSAVKYENHTSRSMKIIPPEVWKSYPNNTDINNTNINQSISLSINKEKKNNTSVSESQEENKKDFTEADGLILENNYKTTEDYFKTLIGYEELLAAFSGDGIVDNVLMNMQEMYFAETTRIAGKDLSRNLIRSSLARLDHFKVLEVIDKFNQQESSIINPKGYIQTMLYNQAFESDLVNKGNIYNKNS